MTGAERYPLWCVDRGTEHGEAQYLGPFETTQEAETRHAEDGGAIRRCRRVRATEIEGIDYMFARLLERLDENVQGGDLACSVPAAWGDWEDQIICGRKGAAEAFREFVDLHIRADAYVCEGDEPAMSEPMSAAEVADAVSKARALPHPTCRLENGLWPPNDLVCTHLLAMLALIEARTGLRPDRVSPSVTTKEVTAVFRGSGGRLARVCADNDNDEGRGDTPDVIVCWWGCKMLVSPHAVMVTLDEALDGAVWREMAAYLAGEPDQAGEGESV